jgi:creatinine amidohydrolase/Fe(II)-dependent formamide hydrolase-like protein
VAFDVVRQDSPSQADFSICCPEFRLLALLGHGGPITALSWPREALLMRWPMMRVAQWWRIKTSISELL